VTQSNLILDLINEASGPGEQAEPSELMEAIATESDPFASLQDGDRANTFFEALHRDFPFSRRVRAGVPLQENERARWVLLLRWLMLQLRNWEPSADQWRERLTAILVVAQAHDWDGALWCSMPPHVLQNAALAARLEALVSAIGVTYGTRGSGPEPIWEREALDRLLAVEGDCDWANMGDAWQPLQGLIHPSPLEIQAVRYLFHTDVALLAKAVINVKQVAVAMLVAQILDTRQRLLLALASGNHFIEFACAYVTLNGQRQRPRSLLGDAKLLSELLAKVAPDTARWRGWMAVFNAYPMRYPALHPSLGEALANAAEEAIDAYVKSIKLFPHQISQIDEGRRNVAACLRIFRAHASAEQRKLLWQRAHERWLAWEFDVANSNTNLFGIMWSELDYAIVGFAAECLDEAGRTQMLTATTSKLSEIEYTWHRSETDIWTAWFRAMSLSQPYALAMILEPTDDWLPEARVWRSPEIATSAYFKLRYPSH